VFAFRYVCLLLVVFFWVSAMIVGSCGRGSIPYFFFGVFFLGCDLCLRCWLSMY